jgi:hypothetical protein
MIEAKATPPDFASAIRHGQPISFATTSLQSRVLNIDAPAVAFTEVADSLGVMCWAVGDQLLTKIEAGIDAAADDEHALDQSQREEHEAHIREEMLGLERCECALIATAEARGEVIDYRVGTSPQAVLAVSLVTVPAPTGTSPGLAYDVIGR